MTLVYPLILSILLRIVKCMFKTFLILKLLIFFKRFKYLNKVILFMRKIQF